MPTVTQEDFADEFIWDTIRTTTNDAGEVTGIQTKFDDGTASSETYRNGLLSFTTLSDSRDNPDLNDFARVIASYDTDGNIINEVTTYDTGLEKSVVNSGGVLQRVILSDESEDGDLVAWTSVERNYDATGNITRETVRFDDGVYDSKTFVNGVQATRLRIDEEEGGGAKSWRLIDTKYDEDGKLSTQSIVYDDGLVREETRSSDPSEAARTVTLEDNPRTGGEGARSFQFVEIKYDDNNAILSKITQNDNGTTREEYFRDGVRLSITDQDGPIGEAGAKGWSVVERRFDEDGVLSQRFTLLDNGVTREDTFTDGELTSTIEYDAPIDGDGNGDVKPWDIVYTEFEDGQKISRFTQNDDGTEKTETFEDGKVVLVETQDADNQKAWSAVYQSITYDDTNDEVRKETVTVFDNDLERTEIRVDGIRVSRTEIDNSEDGSARNFEQAFVAFDDDGNVDFKTLVLDSGNDVYIDYDEGAAVLKYELDADDDQSWVVRETVYLADGTTQTNQYDTIQDVPDGVLDLF